MTIRAVLFDLDCTLTDRRASVAAAARLFAQTYPLPGGCTVERLTEAMWTADHWGYRDRREFYEEVIREIGWKNPVAMPELLRFWAEDHPRCAEAQADAYDVLRELRRRAIRTGIVTNGDVGTQAAKIRYLVLEEEVDLVVISGALGIRKPDPRIFRHALAGLGVEARHALFVGDHPENDIAGAAGAGMRTAWVPGTCRYPADQASPSMTIGSLSQIMSALGEEAGKRRVLAAGLGRK